MTSTPDERTLILVNGFIETAKRSVEDRLNNVRYHENFVRSYVREGKDDLAKRHQTWADESKASAASLQKLVDMLGAWKP